MSDLERVYNTMVKDNEDLACVFMINCGGNVDLYDVMHLDEHDELFIFVADSHRPYHPSNVKNAQNILVLDDISSTEIMYEMTEEEVRSMAIYEADEQDTYSDESEESEEDSEAEEVGEDIDGLGEEEEERETRKKRRRREKRVEFGLVAASEQSTHGFTAAGLLYALALQVGINRKDLLWYSILGLTDQYVHQRIGGSRYRGDLRFFLEKVRNFESSSAAASISTDDFNSHNIVVAPQEFVFMLYRHWNLYESMYHTRSIAVKLGVWGHQGRKNLEQWLARMGLPLEECKQKFVAMKKKFKDRLPEQLEKYAPEFGVTDLYVESFVKKPSFDKEISAFDVVYGAAALLESVRPPQDVGDDTLMEVDSEDDFLKVNFWNAYRSLSHTNNILDEGIDEAIDLQCAIVRQVTSIIQRKDILQLGRYRVAFIKDTPDLKYFTHPLSLSKLAHFLVDTLIDLGRRPSNRCKPLILTAMLPNSDQCLIVGVEGQHSGSSHVPNRFGKAFAQAASKTGVELKYGSFDTSCIQIPKDDLERFREYLRSGYVIHKH